MNLDIMKYITCNVIYKKKYRVTKLSRFYFHNKLPPEMKDTEPNLLTSSSQNSPSPP
jgi:hypothetical protein